MSNEHKSSDYNKNNSNNDGKELGKDDNDDKDDKDGDSKVQKTRICNVMKDELLNALIGQDNPVLFDLLLESWNNSCKQLNYDEINPFELYSQEDIDKADYGNKRILTKNGNVFVVISDKLLNEKKLNDVNERQVALYFAVLEKWHCIVQKKKGNSDNLIDITSFRNAFRAHLNSRSYSFINKLCNMKLMTIHNKHSKNTAKSLFFGSQGIIPAILLKKRDLTQESRIAFIEQLLDTWFTGVWDNVAIGDKENNPSQLLIGGETLRLLINIGNLHTSSSFMFNKRIFVLLAKYKMRLRLSSRLAQLIVMDKNNTNYLQLLTQNNRIFDLNRDNKEKYNGKKDNLVKFIKACLNENNQYVLDTTN